MLHPLDSALLIPDSILSRSQQSRTFHNRSHRPYLYQDYEKAINIIREAGEQEVGLYLGGNDWEYPFWAFALPTKKEGRVMSYRHVGVSNASETLDKNLWTAALKKIDFNSFATNERKNELDRFLLTLDFTKKKK